VQELKGRLSLFKDLAMLDIGLPSFLLKKELNLLEWLSLMEVFITKMGLIQLNYISINWQIKAFLNFRDAKVLRRKMPFINQRKHIVNF
jgi:hypothetical protein